MKNRKKYLVYFLIIWAVQMAAAVYFCTQKQGFHEDEYYTYYSTARTNGFYVEDGQWMDRDVYGNEFVVLPGERFRYGLVKQVQSWDVHPPMYYWVFHTVASLVPNVFSKWIGLSVNLLFYGINIILLAYLSYLAGGRDVGISLLVTLVFGLSPAAMSGVVFIRMYEMLTTFVLLCGILHMRAVERNEEKLSVVKSLIPMATVTYIGFMTQYYYFIFLFFLGIAFCVWLLWRDRNVWNCLRYGVSQGIAFVLAYVTYPSFPGQMFRGQRGAQATENFFDLSNTLGRIRFFWNLMDRFVFGHMFVVFLVIIVLLGVIVCAVQDEKGNGASGQKRRIRNDGTTELDGSRSNTEFCMLLFTAVGYFLAVSKTALLLGETSNRYQLPIYGIVVMLTFVAVRTLWRRLVESTGVGQSGAIRAFAFRYQKYIEVVAVAFSLAIIVIGHCTEEVVFLYPEDQAQTAYAKERAAQNIPAVYLYQPGEEWCIWDVTNELLAYPEVYFAAVGNEGVLEDEKVRNADSLVVYVAKGADVSEELMRVCGGDPDLEGWRYQLVFEEKYCDVYYIGIE